MCFYQKDLFIFNISGENNLVAIPTSQRKHSQTTILELQP